MVTPLAREISRLHHGDHSCLLYATPAQQRAAMAPFFQEGLARGERCLYIADDRTVNEVIAYLGDAGIDMKREMDRGAFTVLTKRETYLKNGAFDPVAMIDTLGETVEETVARGFAGLRGSGEMTWALGTEQGCDRAIEYEALLNDFFPGRPFVALCQYNSARFAPGVLLDVLRTHPYAVIGDDVCPNLYYEPREFVLGHASDAAKLAWRTSHLKAARDAVIGLEEAVRARESFFAVASHELRTPLTVLALRLEQLKREVAKAEQGSLLASIEAIFQQVDQLTELVSRFADVTQLAARGLALHRAETSLGRLVRHVVKKQSAAATKAGSDISIEVHDEATGCWDELRLEQMLSNLLSNAIKFGGGRPIELRVATQGETVVITVRDQGIGIDAAHQRRIFGPFQRAVSPTHYSGFGVGLWMVQQIAEAHGGQVRLQSAPGQGATFTVTLPLRPRD